jgi:large subunit ribosomal protein L24
MKIKKGDKVKVITGDDKGTIAEVIKAFPRESMLLVEGVRLVKKALNPTQANPDGGMIEMESKVHVSNVKLYEEKAKKAAKKAPAKKAASKAAPKKTPAKKAAKD